MALPNALNVNISLYRAEMRRTLAMVPADESIIEIAAPASDAAALEEQLQLLHEFIDHFNDLDKALVAQPNGFGGENRRNVKLPV